MAVGGIEQTRDAIRDGTILGVVAHEVERYCG